MLFWLLSCMILAAVIQHELRMITVRFYENRFMKNVYSLTVIYSEIYPVIQKGFMKGKKIETKFKHGGWLVDFDDPLDGIIVFDILVYEVMKDYYKVLDLVYLNDEQIAKLKIEICRQSLDNMCEELKKLVDYTNKS